LAARVELRQHRRYRLVATVNFEWETGEGIVLKSAGQTRDISAAGVFIVTSELLPTGTSVNLVVNLPSLQDDSSGAQLKTHGRVLRTDGKGFAVIADMGFRMKFSESLAMPASAGQQRPEAGGFPGTSKVFTMFRSK
jgi:PilZ domain-containing protein